MSELHGIFGTGVVISLGILLMGVIGRARIHPTVKLLLISAIALRFIGTFAYIGAMETFYGVADYNRYFRGGLAYAELIPAGRWSELNHAVAAPNHWWGTRFVFVLAAIASVLVGPTLVGQSLLFSLAGLGGLLCFVLAAARARPNLSVIPYLAWIALFPSLWFWPSILGKEALLFLGMGLVVLGYVGRRGSKLWLLLGIGFSLIIAVRPQLGAVVALSLVLAEWLATDRPWSARRIIQGAVIAIGGIALMTFSVRFIGIEAADLTSIEAYFEEEGGSVQSGSTVEVAPYGVLGIPVAIANILLRPFPWEGSNVLALVASIELWTFWLFAWFRRRRIRHALRSWRRHLLLRMAVPFILIYTTSLGMLVANLGVIVRQRTLLFPFLFLFVAMDVSRRSLAPAGGTVPRDQATSARASGA